MKGIIALLLILFPLAGAAKTVVSYAIASHASPGNVCVSPDNRYVYFTASSTIGRVDWAGVVEEFPVPPAGKNLQSLVGCSFDPGGTLYFVDQANLAVHAFTPPSLFATFKVPPPNTAISGLAFHDDGLLYIMVTGRAAVQRMRPEGTFLPPVLLTAGRYPHGPSSCNGNVWFAENGANRVAFITPAGSVSEIPMPSGLTKPFSTACAPDGVYFTLNGSSSIAKVSSPDNGLTHVVSKPWVTPTPASQPRGIAITADGRVVFSEYNANQMGFMPLGGGIITEVRLPRGTGPNKVVAGANGGVWFSGNLSLINEILAIE